jgi:cAMP-dependent protein kinase regulator
MELKFFEAGKIVINQGDVGDEFFVLLNGKVDLLKDGSKLNTLSKFGESFGEIAL